MLNDWLRQQATQYERKDLSRTYVAVRGTDPRVLGYYAISSHRVHYDVLAGAEAKGLPPKMSVPVVLLGRLAIDQSTQRQGLGSILLIDALRRIQHLADQVGIRAVEVDAIDEDARSFYLKRGFVALLDDPRHLFLPMKVIRALNLPPLKERLSDH